MIRLAAIGCGARGAYNVSRILLADESARLRFVADTAAESAKAQLTLRKVDTSETVFLPSAESLLAHTDAFDAIVIGTRCSTHADIAAMMAPLGKPIFLEKPIATDQHQIDRLVKAFDAAAMTPKVVVSFPLRATPLFRAAKSIIASGRLGKINQVVAVNNVNYGGVYFGQWYRDANEIGDLWLQKATHDFDYLNALLDARPDRVSAFGSRLIYGGDMPAEQTCSTCDRRSICPESPIAHARRGDDGGMAGGTPGNDHACCFSRSITHDDASTAVLLYPAGLHVTYTQNFVSRRTAGKRGATITGYDGTLSFDWNEDRMTVIDHHSGRTDVTHIPSTGGHGGGDDVLARNFIAVINQQAASISTLTDGLNSVRACIAAAQSATSGRMVEIGYD